MNTATSPSAKPSNDNPPAKRGESEGAVIHIQGVPHAVVSEQLITCERVRTVNGKAEHYSFQYTACAVMEISK